MNNEYPTICVDDLGFHYTIKFDIIEDIIKQSMFDAKGDVIKIRRYRYGYQNGTEYLFHDDNQEPTFHEVRAMAAERMNNVFSAIPGTFKCVLKQPQFMSDARDPLSKVESDFDLQNILFQKIAEVWDARFGTNYASEFKEKHAKCPVFEGVYIPSDIIMKQNQKRFDEYKQQIQRQQEEINKLKTIVAQQKEQLKQLIEITA